MRVPLLLLLSLTTLAAADSGAPKLSIFPQFVTPGGNVRYRCQVPRNPDNRKVRGGFENYRVFEEQLDGESSRITFERTFLEVPCDPGAAFCEVTRANGRTVRVVASFRVVGCMNEGDMSH